MTEAEHLLIQLQERESTQLQQAVGGVVGTARIGQHLGALLTGLARQFAATMEYKMSMLPAQQTVFVGPALEQQGQLNFRTHLSLPADALKGSLVTQATVVLQSLTQQQRRQIMAVLTKDTGMVADFFGKWLTYMLQQDMRAEDAPEERSDERLAMESRVHAGMEALLGSDAPRCFEALHRYCQGDWMPQARGDHRIEYKNGIGHFSQENLFVDVRTHPHYQNFIDEVPLLLHDAAQAVGKALEVILPEPVAEQRLFTNSEDDRRAVRQCLHVLGTLFNLTFRHMQHADSIPISKIETLCIRSALLSASESLFLGVLHRRFPALLQPPLNIQESDARVDNFESLFLLLKEEIDSIPFGDTATVFAEHWRSLHREMLQHLRFYTECVGQNVINAPYFGYCSTQGSDDLLAGEENVARVREQQRWIQAAHIGKIEQGYAILTTGCRPGVGYGIDTINALYPLHATDSHRPLVSCRSCRQTPDGRATSGIHSFLSPGEIIGHHQPLARIMEQVSQDGDRLHAMACEEQRSPVWLQVAQENSMPVRFIAYSDDDEGTYSSFNLYTRAETEQLNGKRRYQSMSERPDVYDALCRTQYPVPTDDSGNPLPPEELFMDILETDRDDGGEDEEKSPTYPPVGSSSVPSHAQRRSRAGSGAGTR